MLNSIDQSYPKDRQRLLIIASIIEGLRWNVSTLIDRDTEVKFSRLAADLRRSALGDLE